MTGRPTPVVTWLKDGLAIDNNPDYRTSFVDGVCSLHIDETFADDSAKFTCQASNMVGFAQTSATLKVEGESSPSAAISGPLHYTQRKTKRKIIV